MIIKELQGSDPYTRITDWSEWLDRSKPETFPEGATIKFADDFYIIRSNSGDRGQVSPVDEPNIVTSNFKWTLDGETIQLISLPEVVSYYYHAIKSLTGEEPPAFVKSLKHAHDHTTDEEDTVLQDFAACNVPTRWMTGISLIEAAHAMVKDADENDNIRSYFWYEDKM